MKCPRGLVCLSEFFDDGFGISKLDVGRLENVRSVDREPVHPRARTAARVQVAVQVADDDSRNGANSGTMAEAVRERWLGEAKAEALALDPGAAVEEVAAYELPVSPSRKRAPPTVQEPTVKDDYERDTEAPEEIDLMALLLPDGQLPHCLDRFSLQYSMAAFRGWVKQRSPACAAASVAGSWNALMGLARDADGALGQDDVVAVFERNLEESIVKKRGKFERLLGAPIDAVDGALREKIKASGKSLGGKKKEKLTKKHLVRLLREVVSEAVETAAASTEMTTAAEGVPPVAVDTPSAEQGVPVGDDVGTSAGTTTLDPAMALFHEIFQKEGPEEAEEAEEAEEEDEGVEDGAPAEDDDDNDDNDGAAGAEPDPQPVDEDAAALAELQALNGGGGGGEGGGGVGGGGVGGIAFVVDGEKPWLKGKKKGKKKVGKKKKGKQGDDEWNWRADFTGIYSVVGGLEKLRRDKPSTGFFVRPHPPALVLPGWTLSCLTF
eukprot:COSAG02_NODE_137_length_34526_cov_94.448079_1_plen_494_part_00